MVILIYTDYKEIPGSNSAFISSLSHFQFVLMHNWNTANDLYLHTIMIIIISTF